MAASNSSSSTSSLPPFSSPSVGSSGQFYYHYDQSTSLSHVHIHDDGLYHTQPIDPLLQDPDSPDGREQSWDVTYFQPPPADPSLDPSASNIYQQACGPNDSPYPISFIESSPSIGSDGNFEMVDPPTPPDAQVISLGSPYDSDASVEQQEISYYPRPQDSTSFYPMGIIGLNNSCTFSTNSLTIVGTHGPIDAVDVGTRQHPLRTTLPFVNSARRIKEESQAPSLDEGFFSNRVPARKRAQIARCHTKTGSWKRASPDHESSPSGDKKRKIHTTNKRFCHKCKKNFPSRTSLDEHTGSEHPRPYICVFHYAGCNARFDAKNEWKRHVSTKHLGLKYWVCTEGKCADERQSSNQRYAGLPSYGNIFNRKDLYTQHIRRMHASVIGQGTTDYRGADARSDLMVKKMQEDALRIRCRLPTWMPCPVQACDKSFTGATAWDERMEHVAQQHFDNAAAGREPPVEFGGAHDTVLTEWAQRSDIRIVKRTEVGWELCEPLKGEAEYRMATPDVEE
ncbi:hypothetical protein Trihar35433_2746 [Trichoderma harzianum]|nr:hypothetical protein Trihar35433_2746 [Trichoderma harzianum]